MPWALAAPLFAPFLALLLAIPLMFAGLSASGVTYVGGADRAAMLRGLMTKPGAFMVLFASLPVALIVVALAGARSSQVPWRRRLRLERGILPLSGYPVLLLGNAGAVVISISVVAGLTELGWLPPVGKSFEELVTMIRNAPVGLRWLVLVGMSLLPGVGEELMFRGYVQTRLVQLLRPVYGIGLASLLFALFHGDLSYATFVFPGALYLGYIAWRAGSIYPAMLCHVAENAVVQTVQMTVGNRVAAEADRALTKMEAFGAAAAIALAAIAVVIAVRYLESLHRRVAGTPRIASDATGRKGADLGPAGEGVPPG